MYLGIQDPENPEDTPWEKGILRIRMLQDVHIAIQVLKLRVIEELYVKDTTKTPMADPDLPLQSLSILKISLQTSTIFVTHPVRHTKMILEPTLMLEDTHTSTLMTKRASKSTDRAD